MQLRRFAPDDAEFCFHLRNQVIRDLFRSRLHPEEIAAAVSAYRPADYTRMAGQGAIFIMERSGQRAGFFYLKRIDTAIAELCLIYIDPRSHGQGIGRRCINHIDQWVSSNWKEVATLVVVTFVPGYNAEFYKKVGFAPLEHTVCELSGLPLKALRLSRPVRSRDRVASEGS
jgi:GNAT superfamily N-acetyltransferase